MPPSSEFIPIGTLITASDELNLKYPERRDLIYEMQQTGRELEENPLVTPTLKVVQLGRINLLDSNGQATHKDKLWLQFSETDDGRRNAMIGLREDDIDTRLQLSRTSDNWYVWPKGAEKPSERITNDQMVLRLYPKMRNKEILEPLLDTTGFDAMAIPHLLAAHLSHAASRRKRKLVYQTIDPTIQGIDIDNDDPNTSYISSAKTELSVYSNNGRFIHKIETGALYPFEKMNMITKTYTYAAETGLAGIYKEESRVAVSSSDGFSKAELEAYATTDQLSSEPFFTLYRSLDTLRDHLSATKDN